MLNCRDIMFETLQEDIQIVSDLLGDLIKYLNDSNKPKTPKRKIITLCDAVQKMIWRICELNREICND